MIGLKEKSDLELWLHSWIHACSDLRVLRYTTLCSSGAERPQFRKLIECKRVG